MYLSDFRPSITTILNNKKGQFNFDSVDLVAFDNHDNGIVEFVIDGIPAISFNAERTIDGNLNPGNTHFNGFLSTANSIFCGGNLNGTKVTATGNLECVGGIVQVGNGTTNGGLIKFFDTGSNAWVDVTLYNGTLRVDGIETANISSGPTVDRPANATTGQSYFDVDLVDGNGKPIWFNGTDWVDASGTIS